MIEPMQGTARNPLAGARGARFLCFITALSLVAPQAWAQPAANPSGAGQAAAAAPVAAPAPETAAPPPEAVPADEADPRALTDFRPALDPHGSWVQDPVYGLVWIPHQSVVGRDFAPYVTSGHWELTRDDQWIWVSDHPFGWVVFHYGRWVWTNSGWAWIPGYRYAPAWVDWRVADYDYGYVGWAPYPPSYVWFNGVAVSLWFTPYYAWVFCPSHYVFSPHVHYHLVRDRSAVYRIAGHTRIYGGSRYYYGVPRAPSPSVARIPARAVPRQRAEADPRSLEISRRSSMRDVSASRIAPRNLAPAPGAAAGAGNRGGVIRGGQRAPLQSTPEPRQLPDARAAAPRAQAPAERAPRPSTESAPVLRRPRVSTPPPRPSRGAAPRSLPSRAPMQTMPRAAPSRRSR